MSFQQLIDKYYIGNEDAKSRLLRHSRSVADMALDLNASLGLKIVPDDVETAAMLHDIGIVYTHAPAIGCHGHEPYIRHGLLGAELLRAEGIDEKYARVCERHTGTGITAADIAANDLPLPLDRVYMPETPLEKLVCYADKFYSKSGDMERKPRSQVIQSLLHHGQEAVDRFLEIEKSLGISHA